MTSGPTLPADAERPGEDTWGIWTCCGERAAVEALRCTWGEAYDVGVDGSQWWFRRKDGIGGTETAASPDCLLAQIVIDHGALPVRCPQPARGPLTATGYHQQPPVVAHRPDRRPHHPPAAWQMEVDVMNNLSRLSPSQLGEAYRAVDRLCGVKDALDTELAIKLDTLHADLAAAIEDRTPVDLGECRAAEAG
ncbi:MAG: hypothetical protein ACRDNF_21480 [Streptosporangiaceae bacterium]